MSTATLHTTMGDIVVELFPNHAPKQYVTLWNLQLAQKSGATQLLEKQAVTICMTAQFFIA